MGVRDVRRKITELLAAQKFGILATLGRKGYPYQSIVAFTATGGMKYILFATFRSTSKYRNLQKSRQVSVFIDDRSNRESDLHAAAGMTALGDAAELSGDSYDRSRVLLIRKHPALKEFLLDPDCAVFRIKVRTYQVVLNFQEVTQIQM